VALASLTDYLVLHVKVQLLYFAGCPNVENARQSLRAALAACSAGNLTVEEIDVEASTTPRQLRSWGSPTILVDGVDVAGAAVPTGVACRLYDEGASGVPRQELIEVKLRQAMGTHSLSDALDPS
jgi:hypothetical protein